MKAWWALAACVVLSACGDDDGPGADSGPAADGTTPPPPLMDAGLDGGPMDAGPIDMGATRPDLGPLDAGPGLELPTCDPRDPASCPEGESCKLVGGSGAAQFTCRFGGTVAAGEPCSFAFLGFSGLFTDNCASGLFCSVEGPGTGRRCVAPCASVDGCADGEVCRFLGRGFPPFPFVGLCRAPDDCDATRGTGCASGETCIAYPDFEVVSWASYCEPVGPLGEGELCFGTETCGAGLACSIVPEEDGGFVPPTSNLVPSRCQRVCDAEDPGASACGEATTGCVPVALDNPAVGGLCRLPDPEPIGPPDRLSRIVVPASYDGATPLPLFLLLHGYTGDGASTDGVLRFYRAAQAEGLLGITPTGETNEDGATYWNVAPVACTGSDCPDDVAYLLGLIDEMKERYRVDADRVYVVGISNGAFMAYRLACDGADRITAIASLAGATPIDETTCNPSRPVSVLAVHGDADINVTYVPSATSAGAVESVEEWASRASCDVTMPTMGAPFDLSPSIEGDETTVRSYTAGCMPGLDAELWTTVGGDHFIFGTAADDFPSRLTSWLLRHTR